MTLYCYDKYRIVYTYSMSLIANVNEIYNLSVTGYAQYALNSSTGVFSVSTAKTTDQTELGEKVYNIVNGNLVEQYFTLPPGTLVSKTYESIETGTRGTFSSTISAGETAYPLNGISGSYWYIRQDLAETATLTTPVGGEIWNTTHTLNWIKSDSGVNVDIELSLNNGSTWKRISSNNALLTTNYNFTNEIETTNAKIRIRAVDGGAVGVWFTSGAFTIQHNVVPTKPPTLNIPALKSGENAIITWAASYDADGDIIKYYLERAINGGSYAIILNGLSVLTYTDSILTTYNTVRYRVRAYDDTAYSIYNESTLRTVQHFPDFKMKIGGVLKSSDSGWVKINGELKQISTITIKDNGVLKEV